VASADLREHYTSSMFDVLAAYSVSTVDTEEAPLMVKCVPVVRLAVLFLMRESATVQSYGPHLGIMEELTANFA
jgi:hypothetical protein